MMDRRLSWTDRLFYLVVFMVLWGVLMGVDTAPDLGRQAEAVVAAAVGALRR